MSNEARSNIPEKQGWKTVLWVVFLLVWTFASVIVSQLVTGRLMLMVLGAEQFTQTVWMSVYFALSYALALVLVILVPPKLAAIWSIKVKKRKVVSGASKSGEVNDKVSSREELGLNGTPTWTDIGLAPIGFIAGTLAAMGLTYVFQLFPWFDAEEVQNVGYSLYISGWERGVAFVLLVIIAPIVEEVIFRGWLYGKLRTRLAMPVAILIVSALFGLVHLQWNVGVNVFAMSIVLCGLREITGTIYAGMLMHMIKNGVAFYLLYIAGGLL